MGRALLTAGTLVKQAVLSFRYNWGLAVLSVVLAIALWVYVTDQQNPEETGRIPGMVQVQVINVPDNQAVSSISPEGVTVNARAPQDTLNDLEADDFRATIDLSGVTAERAVVDVRVEALRTRVEVVDWSPQRVTVQIENVTSRSVPIEAELVGTPPRGFEVGATTVQPAQSQVTGPESLVALVDSVAANVNLTGISTNFQQTLLLEARDGQGVRVDGVTVEPASARVTVEVRQLQFSAAFVVLPDIRGTPAQGFRVVGMAIDPQFLIVSGPADVFQTLDPTAGVMTEVVSIDGASADVVRTVALRLPPGASAARTEVTVRVLIAAVASGAAITPGP